LFDKNPFFFFCNKTPQKKPKLNIPWNKKKKKPLAKILLAKQNLSHWFNFNLTEWPDRVDLKSLVWPWTKLKTRVWLENKQKNKNQTKNRLNLSKHKNSKNLAKTDQNPEKMKNTKNTDEHSKWLQQHEL
jgi:hypothetical protein